MIKRMSQWKPDLAMANLFRENSNIRGTDSCNYSGHLLFDFGVYLSIYGCE